MDSDAAMMHLRNVLSMLAELAPGDRCRAFDNALMFYNASNPDEMIEPVPGYESRIIHTFTALSSPKTTPSTKAS